MSGLRLRPQQTPSSARVVGDDTKNHPSSCSTVRKFPLSPQSFNAILHPPLRNSCPAKIPSFYDNNTLSSRMLRRCTLRLNVTRVFYIGVALTIGFILGLQFMALQSIGGGHNNENSQYNSKSTVPNPKYNVRRRTERRHPRIAYHMVRNESSAFNHGSTTTFWKRFLSSSTSREKQIIDDPMLHHDGWAATVTTDQQNVRNFNDNNGECAPMAAWQTTSYPNCNTIHEIDLVLSSGKGSIAFPPINNKVAAAATTTTMRRRWLTRHPWQHLNEEHDPHPKNPELSATMGIIKQEDIAFLGQGWFRAAWRMDVEGLEEYDDEEDAYYQKESVVLKTLRYERDFLEEYYELHRRDALAMERLTASPYVLDVYGYCGQSAINELANFGIEGMSSLEKVARGFRGLDIEPVSKIKLQLAAMVAQGVSHLHSIDYPDFVYPDSSGSGNKPRAISNATLVHYDLNPRNIAIVKRGKPKLNDFNVAEFLMWNPKTNTKCGFEGRFKEPWWRAPEEMQVQMTEYSNPPPLTEKVDVYSLGNILWDLLTTHSPWGKMKSERQDEVRPKVAKGELPKLPPPYDTLTLKDPALKALKDAMYKCFRLNPEDRPSAGEIAEELAEALGNLPEGFGDKSKFKAEIEKFDRRRIREEEEQAWLK